LRSPCTKPPTPTPRAISATTPAYAAGRMSLNPLRHIDPFGTILLPACCT
jgi:Zn-dependent protease